ncbi:MAG: hypothetical protein JWN84_2188, partial [Nocardioides sp.]|nr:hypothetical protein [Nocardioides sp.]
MIALVVALTSALFTLSTAQPAAGVVKPTVVNGGVESGRAGFRAFPVRWVHLATSPIAHSGGSALRVWSHGPTRARVVTTTSSHDVPAESLVTARAWVRSARRGQPVVLVLRESNAGRTVRTETTTVRPSRGRWTRVHADLRTRTDDSALSVVVRAPRTQRRLELLVDDVSLTTAPRSTTPTTPASSGTATTTDAPTQGPTETPTTTPTSTPTSTPTTTPPSEPAETSGGDVLTDGCSYGPRGLPACGAYLGATYGSNTEPTTLEDQLGRRLGVRRTFWTGAQVDKAVRVAAGDLAKHRLPWISFKLPHSWQDMTAGRGDAWVRDLARRLAALPGPVWVAFHHEPEGDGDITAWRTMQERLAPIVRATAPNVAYTVIVTGWNQFYGAAQYSLSRIWPRGVEIDVAGFDLYNEYGVTKDGRTSYKWPDFDTEYYAKIQTWAAEQG